MELHSFYCINCGKKTYELMRPIGHKYNKHHRKVLYCPWCKNICNSIECRNEAEIYEFREAFNDGKYINEAIESTNYIKENNILELIH